MDVVCTCLWDVYDVHARVQVLREEDLHAVSPLFGFLVGWIFGYSLMQTVDTRCPSVDAGCKAPTGNLGTHVAM